MPSSSTFRALLSTLLFVLLFACGCGGGGGSSASSSNSGGASVTPPPVISPPAQQVGNLLIKQVLLRAVPSEVTQIRLTVFNVNGQALYGPETRAKAAELLFENVPTAATTAQLEYLNGAKVVGLATIAVTVQEGQTTVINDPPFSDVSAVLRSLRITPSQASIAAGTEQKFDALASYSDGTELNVSLSVTWASSAPSVSSVNASGRAQSLAPGQTNISATLGSVEASATLNVTAASITSVVVTPSTLTLADGTQGSLRAFANFSDQSQQEVTESAQWSSENESVSVVDGQGRVRAVDPGQTSISAEYLGQSGEATALVTSAVAKSLAIRPENPSVPLGLAQQFRAYLILTDDTEQELIDQVQWSSSNTAIFAVDGSGLAVSRSVGQAVLSANFGELQAQTNFEVSEAVLDDLEIEPGEISVAEGTSSAWAAFALYTDGSRLDVTSQAAWESSAPNTASVDGEGLVTGLSIGLADISASFGEERAQNQVTVTDAILQTLVLSPSEQSLAKGVEQQYTATGRFSNGQEQNLSSEVVWSTAPGAVAEIDPSGLLTGLSLGNATVSAVRGGISGSTGVTITDAVPVSFAVTPSNAETVFARVQYSAILTYSDGSTVDVSDQATWESSDTRVGRVDTKGLVSTGSSTVWVVGQEDSVPLVAPVNGSSVITASYDGFSSNASFTVFLADAISGLIFRYVRSISAPGTTRAFNIRTFGDPQGARDVTSELTLTSDNPDFAFRGNGVFEISPSATHGSQVEVSGQIGQQRFSVDHYINRFLFQSSLSSNMLTSYQVTEDGHLVSLGQQTTDSAPRDLVVHPSGRTLFSANNLGNSITAYHVNSNGTLGGKQAFATTTRPNSLEVMPDGSALLVAGQDGINAYRPYSNGFGQEQGRQLLSGGHTSLVIDPAGRHLFALTGSLNTLISAALSREPSGNLRATQRGMRSPTTQFRPLGLASSRDGRTLYAISTGDNKVYSYQVADDSTLTDLGSQPTGLFPRDIIVHPNGQVAYVANYQGNSVSLYDVAETGALVFRNTISTLPGPRKISLDPGGKFAYITFPDGNQISSYSIGQDGSLSLIESLTSSGQPYDFATTP